MRSQHLAFLWVLLSLTLAAVGCDGRSSGPEGPSPAACSDLAVSTGSLGERTAYPWIQAFVTPSSFALQSVNYVALPAEGDIPSRVLLYAEVSNGSGETLCASIPEVRLGGQIEDAVMDGSPHDLPGLSVSFSCVPAGQSGFIYGIFRGMTEADLESASSLTIDVSNNAFSGMGEAPVFATSISGRSTEEFEGGHVVNQRVTASQDLTNYYQDLWIEDDRGLLIGRLNVPHNSSTAGGVRILAGETVELRSETSPCPIVASYSIENFILD